MGTKNALKIFSFRRFYISFRIVHLISVAANRRGELLSMKGAAEGLKSAFSILSSRGSKKVVRWLTQIMHCENGVGGGAGPFLAMHDCFRNEDLGISGSGH
jgi:hypothetical protein